VVDFPLGNYLNSGRNPVIVLGDSLIILFPYSHQIAI